MRQTERRADGCRRRHGAARERHSHRRPPPQPRPPPPPATATATPVSPLRRWRAKARRSSPPLFLAARRHAEAARQFRTAARLQPADADALFNLGGSHELLEQPAEALHAYRGAPHEACVGWREAGRERERGVGGGSGAGRARRGGHGAGSRSGSGGEGQLPPSLP
jgi:hypothetical protein